MNAYLVSGGEHDVLQEYIGCWPRYEPAFLVDIICAETRGQARAIFARLHHAYLDFTEVEHIRLVARDVNRETGAVRDNDPLWDAAPDL